MNPKWLKFLFFFFLFLAIFQTFTWALSFFADPQLNRFQGYHRLWNWDLKQHADGDYDADGQVDVITFTGCAFLSSVRPEEIPPDQQCQATGIYGIFWPDQENPIGQKYIDTDQRDLDLTYSDNHRSLYHSYVAKNANENWKIVVNSDSGLQLWEITDTGLLVQQDHVPFTYKADEILYTASSLFIILALIQLPVFLVLSPLTLVIRSQWDWMPVMYIVFMTSIAAVFYFLWRRASVRLK